MFPVLDRTLLNVSLGGCIPWNPVKCLQGRQRLCTPYGASEFQPMIRYLSLSRQVCISERTAWWRHRLNGRRETILLQPLFRGVEFGVSQG